MKCLCRPGKTKLHYSPHIFYPLQDCIYEAGKIKKLPSLSFQKIFSLNRPEKFFFLAVLKPSFEGRSDVLCSKHLSNFFYYFIHNKTRIQIEERSWRSFWSIRLTLNLLKQTSTWMPPFFHEFYRKITYYLFKNKNWSLKLVIMHSAINISKGWPNMQLIILWNFI